MKITGNLYKVLPSEEIVMKDGSKRMKNEFVIMSDGDFPKPMAFELWGDEKASMLKTLSVGDGVEVSFYITSSETQRGGYRTSLRCVGVGATGQGELTHDSVAYPPVSVAMPFADDGLPFDNEETPF